MEDLNFRKGDAKTDVFGSDRMLQPSPVEKIPDGPTTPEVAYQMVKDETFAQTQPRLNLATFVTTYMDEYATKLMNEAININYIDETEYPRIAVMNGKCINNCANFSQTTWKPVEITKFGLSNGLPCACLFLRQRNQAATPPNIHASEEPIAKAPVFQVSFSGEFHKLATMLIHLPFITAIRGYSVSSM